MKRLVPLLICLISGVILPGAASAAVSLPWSTTYNCADWSQSSGLSNVNCDGLSGWGGWTCDNGDGTVKEEQITASANNSGGGGGKGQRQWVGDGTNNNSGGVKIDFTSPQKELWVRWYMRYEQGFKWSALNYDKILYFNPGEPHCFVTAWYSSDYSNVGTCASPGNHLSTTGNGWNSIMGSTASDGKWHTYEVHVKMDTNGSDGIAELWIDGIKRLSYSDVNFATQQGWTVILIGSNQATPSNGKCMYVDFDDIAVSTTGYIGPLSTGTDTLAPMKPSGPSVTTP